MPAPHRPLGSRSRKRPHRRGRPRRPRRWGLRLAGGAAVLVLAASGVGHAVVGRLDTGIRRLDPFVGLHHRPARATGDALNFLVVGTDGRDQITAREREKYRLGGEPCHCTDTIVLVHVSADREHTRIVSIPRDSYVELPAQRAPETGRDTPARPAKLNAAYAVGGPGLTVRAVEQLTGVHIDHYLEVDFTSFMRTVDVLGGVEICTVRPLKDDHTGLDLPAGTSRLDGGQALQYVRSRHVDGAADLGRMQRQQRFLAALLRQVSDSGALVNPVKFNAVASALLDSVRADEGLDSRELLELGRAMKGLSPSSSEFASVPVKDPSYPVPGVGSTVRWNEKRATELFEALREDRPLSEESGGAGKKRNAPVLVDVAPREVRVQVENGTTRNGLARDVEEALRATGFATTGDPRDADRTGVERTQVTYDPEWDRSARTLGAALPGAELKAVRGHGPVATVTLGTAHHTVRKVRLDDPSQEDGRALNGEEVGC
ncbi:LCP family protein [Streptomyces sp. TP-A0874]|uniref:LCP family protein n=1 Tax=Streptomyces sp. TP-A0874 TaxID=549819 RepID=UPI000852EDE0|nr:LCP family protein [Streptomyces sp. TP-A0874]